MPTRVHVIVYDIASQCLLTDLKEIPSFLLQADLHEQLKLDMSIPGAPEPQVVLDMVHGSLAHPLPGPSGHRLRFPNDLRADLVMPISWSDAYLVIIHRLRQTLVFVMNTQPTVDDIERFGHLYTQVPGSSSLPMYFEIMVRDRHIPVAAAMGRIPTNA